MSAQILIWYRNDLRLHDHEPLVKALKSGAKVIGVYCFDDIQFGQSSFGFPKTGAFRTQFLLESVTDLRSAWRDRGSDLIVRRGCPTEIIPAIAKELNVAAVYYHQEVTDEEVATQLSIEATLKAFNIKCQSWWGHTLYHPDDLPFNLDNLPELFTAFRKNVEQKSNVRRFLPAPTRLSPWEGEIERGNIPEITEFGFKPPQFDPRSVMLFTGGETAAILRLEEYFWQRDRLRIYKDTRNGMLGTDYSSKFSPWLALGCISPRFIHAEIRRYEEERIENDSTYWMIFELLWRDYFRFVCAKHGKKIFFQSGLRGVNIAWKKDPARFLQWCEGKTGYPLVDANMRELAATGFMSNRGRQNVGSFLTKNLGIDWRMGAEWFESLLIDYDVCSNWGNWNYTAGVGNDARGFRFFNISKQAQDYDRDGKYVKHWLPELAQIPAAKVHEPWKLLPVEQTRFEINLGVDYPNPVVDLFKSAKANEVIYNAAFDRSHR
jgi:deoxyribodipyrimidine photo-lyase